MILQEKSIILRDGRTALLRSPGERDAAQLLDMMQRTLRETPYLTSAPEDCLDMTVEQETAWIARQVSSDTVLNILCEVDGRLAGNCEVRFTSRAKLRHRANVGISLLREYWGLGIGTAMFETMIEAARARGVTHMDLAFIEGNSRARALYEKMGFRLVGVMPDAVRQSDGKLVSEYWMQLVL